MTIVYIARNFVDSAAFVLNNIVESQLEPTQAQKDFIALKLRQALVCVDELEVKDNN